MGSNSPGHRKTYGRVTNTLDLRGIDKADRFTPVVDALDHPDPMVRKSMARYLAGRIPPRHVKRVINRLLVEEWPDVVKWLALGVALTRRPSALDALRKKRPLVVDEMALDWIDAGIATALPSNPQHARDLVSSIDADSRQHGTIVAWGQEGLDEETVALLSRRLEDESPKTRRWASLALYKHNALSDVAPVLHNLEDDDFRLREWTAHVITPLTATRALPLLIDMFERDAAPRAREWAARALSSYNDQEVRELLYERYNEEADPFVREAIAVGIAKGPFFEGDNRFLGAVFQTESSPLLIGELLRAVSESQGLSSSTTLMENAEKAALRLSVELNLPSLYAGALSKTASVADKSALIQLKSSPVARLLVSSLLPTAKGEYVNPTIAVVIALHEEFEYVRDVFQTRGIVLNHSIDELTGRMLYNGEYRSLNGRAYSLRVVVVGRKGPNASAVETTRVIMSTSPSLLATIGIAGSLDPNVTLANAVVGSIVDNYIENSKAVATTNAPYALSTAGEPFRSDALLVDRAVNLKHITPDSFTEIEKIRAGCLSEINHSIQSELTNLEMLKPFSLTAGPIASGPIVGASARFAEWLLSLRRDYKALEMESGSAAESVDMVGGLSHTRFVAVRGISDFSDERKRELDRIGEGVFRRAATAVAIATFLAIIDASADVIGSPYAA